MPSILSTKKLEPKQREDLLRQGFAVVDYNAIEIEYLDINIPHPIKNAIFTSQNSVRAFLKQKRDLENQPENVFCVGQKTKALLEENGLNVTKMADNSRELGDFIVNYHKSDSFYYFCGSIRRDELPNKINTSKINLIEVKSYKTSIKPRKFDEKWDGILFFSPSGVESFVLENKLENTFAFCIGETTAKTARNYSTTVVISDTSTVESVIAKTLEKINKK